MYILQVYKLQKSRFISILGTFRESRSTPFVRLLFHSIRLDLSIHPSSVQTITLQKQHLSLCREIWISSFSIPPSSKHSLMSSTSTSFPLLSLFNNNRFFFFLQTERSRSLFFPQLQRSSNGSKKTFCQTFNQRSTLSLLCYALGVILIYVFRN